MQVKPLADRVLIRPLEAEEMKRGEIIIPDTAKEKPQEGEVIEVGPGRVTDDGKKIPLEVCFGIAEFFQV
jgi:chaperonin GroES